MIFSVCEQCRLHLGCQSPIIKGKGNLTPKFILVRSSPEIEEDILGHIQDSDILKATLGENLSQAYVTLAVKCVSYKDPISRLGGSRQPSQQEIKYCNSILFKELMIFDENIPIFTLGSTALKAFIPENEGITKELGIAKKVNVHNKIFTIIPNYDLGYVSRNPNLITQFKQVFMKALSGTIQHAHTGKKVKLLNYEESVHYLNGLLDQYKSGEIDYTVFDIESTSLSPFKGKSIMYSFATENDAVAYSIPLVVNNDFKKENTLAAFGITPELELLRQLDQIPQTSEKERNEIQKLIDTDLESKFQDLVTKYTVPFDISIQQAAKIDYLIKQVVETIPIIGQNLKFDLMFKMVESGYDLYKVKVKWDTYISGHQIQGTKAGSLSLKNQAKTLFNVEDDWDNLTEGYLSKYRFLEERNFGNIPTGVLGEYSALDAYWNKFVYKSHMEKISSEQMDILREITQATIPFAEAEGKGMFVDEVSYNFIKNSFDSAVKQYLEEMRTVPQVQFLIEKNIQPLRIQNNSPRKRKKITEEQMIEDSFSPNSHPQVREILHGNDYFGLPINQDFMTEGGKSGKKEAQTGSDALADLLSKLPPEKLNEKKFIGSLLSYKEISTLKNRFDKIPDNTVDSLYKTDFFLATTVTGRLSSPLHSIPTKSDFKRIFISRWKDIGGLFLAADQSQLEVRVGSSIANETTLIEAYKTGMDVHTQTAADIFKIPFQEVSSKQRGIAKTINFGIFYGKTAMSLADELGISKKEAQDFIDQWYSTKPNIKKWIPEQIERVFRDGYVLTPMGRVIPVPEVFSKDFKIRKHAENCAVNYVVQSSASDLSVRSGNEIAFQLKQDKKRSLFLASVHDSLEYDIYPGELFYMIKKIKLESEDNIQKRYDWVKCPLKMDIALGASWGGALELNIKELSDTHLIATAEGLRKDFIILQIVAEKAYRIEIKVLDKSTPKPFPIDCAVRDTENWKAEIMLSLNKQ